MSKEIICLMLVYFVFANLFTFLLFGADKRKAVKGKWRIPEATLLFFAAIGGSVGALLGMIHYRHKTKKPKFYVGVPVILILQSLLALLILYIAAHSYD